MDKATSFEVLPIEIANQICTFLGQWDISRLSLATKAIYQLIRPILYRYPSITSFTSLVLFQRTITQATYMGKVDNTWSARECLDQTKTLNLTIDPTKGSAQAVMLSRMIQAIVRRCPNLSITLSLEHCQCAITPVSVLIDETFPRVIKIAVYVGRNDPDEPLDPVELRRRKHNACSSNTDFWKPFVDGNCFPDCRDLEIRHYWAKAPPVNASLDLTRTHEMVDILHGSQRDPISSRYRYRNHGVAAQHVTAVPQIGSTSGLKNFEKILLECPPELNSSLLMQLLGNPNSVATNLAKLELRFCQLDMETISKLLYHAPPNLKHLVLLCPEDYDDFDDLAHHERPHICPLLRDFSKQMVHLEFAAATVCRELFFDDLERETLRNNGVMTGLGTSGGAIEGHEKLDTHAVRETIQTCRKSKRTKYRNSRVNTAITEAKAQSSSAARSSSLFGGTPNPSASASRFQREVEAALDEEEERRSRLISGSKIPWFRRIIAWQGLCNAADTWAEIELAVEMEEPGIEFVLVNKELQIASQHASGKPSMPINMRKALDEKYDLGR